MHGRRAQRSAVCCCWLVRVLVPCIVFARTTVAQWAGSVYDPELPLVTESEQAGLREKLSLSQGQVDYVDALLEQRSSDLGPALARIAETKRRYQSLLDGVDAFPAPGSPEAIELAALRKSVLDQIDTIQLQNEQTLRRIAESLTEDQRAVWSRFLMDRRRNRTLDRATRFSGEGVDVIELMRSCELGNAFSSEIERIENQYVAELDLLLRRRNGGCVDRERALYARQIATLRGEVQPEGAELQGIPKDLPPGEIRAILSDYQRKAAELMEERLREEEPQMEIHRQIRDLNRSTVDAIAGALSSDRGDDLRKRYLASAYPGIYGQTRLDAWLDTVVALELAGSQRDGISGAIHDYYNPYRHQYDLALQALKDREEDAWKDVDLNRVNSKISDERASLIKKRNDLMDDVLLVVWPILTEQQQAKVGFPELHK